MRKIKKKSDEIWSKNSIIFFIYCIVHWVGVPVKYADFEKCIKIIYEISIVRHCGSATISNILLYPSFL